MPRLASSTRDGAPSGKKKIAHRPSPPPAATTAGGRVRAVPCSPAVGLSGKATGAQKTRLAPTRPLPTSGRAASVGAAPPDPNMVLSSTASAMVPAYLMGTMSGGGGGSGRLSGAGYQPNDSARLTQSAMTRAAMNGTATATQKLGRENSPALTQARTSVAAMNKTAWSPQGTMTAGATSTSGLADATTTYKVGKAVLNPFVAIAPAVQQNVRGMQAADDLPEAARRPLTGAVIGPLETELLFPATPRGAGLEALSRERSADGMGVSPTDGGVDRTAFERLSPDAQEDIMSPVSMPIFTATMLQQRTSASAAMAMTTPAGALAAAAISGAQASQFGNSPWSLDASGAAVTGAYSSAINAYTAPMVSTRLSNAQPRPRRAQADVVKLSSDLAWLKDQLHPAQDLLNSPPDGAALAMAPSQRVDDRGMPLMCAEEIVLDGGSSGSSTGARGSVGGESRGVGVLRGLYGITKKDTTSIRSLRACVAGDVSTTAVDVLPALLHAERKTKELVTARRLVDWDAAIPTAENIVPPVIAFLDRSGTPLTQKQRCNLVLNSATFDLSEAPTAATASTGAAGEPVGLSVGSALVYQPSGKESDGGAGAIGHHRICGMVGLVKGLAERVGMERVLEYQVRTANADMLLAPPRMVGADLVLRINPSLQGTILLTIVGYDCAHVSRDTDRVLESANTLTCAVTIQYKGTQDGTAESTALAATNKSRNNNSSSSSHGAATTGTVQCASQYQSEKSAEERELAQLKADRLSSSLFIKNSGGGGAGASTQRPHTAGLVPEEPANGAPHFVFPLTNPYELRYSVMRDTVRALLMNTFVRRLAERASAEKEQKQAKQQQQQQQQQEQTQAAARRAPSTADSKIGSASPSLQSSMCKDVEESPTTLNGTAAGTGDTHPASHHEDASNLSAEPSACDGALEVDFDAMATAVPVFGAAEPTSARRDKTGGSPSKGPAEGGGAPARPTRRRVTLLFTGSPAEGVSSRAATAASSAAGKSCDGCNCDSPDVEAAPEMHEEQELRSLDENTMSFLPASGCLQSHGYNLRLAAWQDHLTSLFADEDKALFDSEARSAFKRHVRQELSDTLLSSLSVGRSAVLGRSSTGVISGPAAASSGASAAAAGGASSRRSLTSANDGAAATAQMTSEHSLAMLRRLLLCLMCEDNRSSLNLYNDAVSVATHLAHNALLRSTSCTGGTPESLQRISTSVLSSSAAATTTTTTTTTGTAQLSTGTGTRLSEKDRRNLALLVDALNVAMCAMFHVGNLRKAITFGVQRVHALCVLEGAMNAVVAAAQRDIAELYLLFGDYALAVRTAEEVLLIAEQLFDANSNEVCSAETLLFIACHEGGYHTRRDEMRTRMLDALQRLTSAPTAGLSPAAVNNRRTLMAEIHLAVCVALPPLTFTSFAALAAAKAAGEVQRALDHLYEAIVLLRGDGDLADIDKSFSTFASVASAGTAHLADPFFRGEEGRQKRRRWSFLSQAAGMLMRLGEHTKGMALLESLVEELVLGKHRYAERTHRAQIGALAWVNIALWRLLSKPTENDENIVLLRRMVHRLTTVMGPLHMLSALGNLVLAYARRTIPSQVTTAGKLALKSLSVLRSQLASRSAVVLTGYRLCTATCALSEGRWMDLLDHANSALLIAQVNHVSEEMLCTVEKEFLASLLLCPATALVRLNADLLLGRLEERLERLTDVYGPQSEVLLTPLCNLSDACYLLGDLAQSLQYIQRAVRLADPKGILFVSAGVLKPAAVLASSADVARRDQLVHAVLETTARIVHLGELLFALAAVLEASGNAADAQDCYARSLSLYEVAKLQSTLPAARVQAALAKLLYSSGAYGDALGWGLGCERIIHDRYGAWKGEVQRSHSLVKAIEAQLAIEEGSYVMVNTNNTNLDYLELI